MNGIASALRDQLYERSDQRIGDGERLDELIAKADQWARTGIPADDPIEEENRLQS